MDGQFENPEKILAEALPHGIIVFNHEGKVKWWNLMADRYLSLTKEKSNIYDIFPEKNIHDFLKNGGFEAVKLLSPVNSEVYLTLSVRPYLNDHQILIIQDFSAQYRLDKMRQDFIANVSHELRTPLTVFRGYLEILLDQQGIGSDQVNAILVQMAEQEQRMEDLVQDLLLLARLESAEPELDKHQSVNVPSLIKDIYRAVGSLGEQHNFDFEVDSSLMLVGEPHELRSAFTNIIVNAMKYTASGGKILIRWYQDSKGKHFCVTDTGIGIEKKHLDRVTQRFYRVDKARTRADGGTGLGLAIVKHVLLRHKGELVIKSQIGKGSTFCCTFKIKK